MSHPELLILGVLRALVEVALLDAAEALDTRDEDLAARVRAGDAAIDALEDQIFEGGGEDIVRDISNVKQEIINYRKIIKPQRPTLRLLERHVKEYAPQDLEIYFDDIVDKNERIWDLLENSKEVAEALEATNEAVITHRLNEVIRVLTILSALVLPLTLITGFYGMNVDGLFFAHHGIWSVLFTLGVMAGTGAALLLWFRRKKWI